MNAERSPAMYAGCLVVVVFVFISYWFMINDVNSRKKKDFQPEIKNQ